MEYHSGRNATDSTKMFFPVRPNYLKSVLVTPSVLKNEINEKWLIEMQENILNPYHFLESTEDREVLKLLSLNRLLLFW